MAEIFDASVSSDSEDDVDYVPPSGAVSGSSADEDFSDSETKLKSTNVKTSKKTEERESKVACNEATSEVDKKKKADDIWRTFMSEVGMKQTAPSTNSVKTKVETHQLEAPENKALNEVEKSNRNVFEFAGEAFVIGDNVSHDCILGKRNDEVSANINTIAQKRAKISLPSTNQPTHAQPQKRGLGSVLGTILDKKQKMTTLQKSLYDWKTFKKSEGLEEELETYNKGKGGFIERQRFLQRSDFRSFETEKSLRLSRKKD